MHCGIFAWSSLEIRWSKHRTRSAQLSWRRAARMYWSIVRCKHRTLSAQLCRIAGGRCSICFCCSVFTRPGDCGQPRSKNRSNYVFVGGKCSRIVYGRENDIGVILGSFGDSFGGFWAPFGSTFGDCWCQVVDFKPQERDSRKVCQKRWSPTNKGIKYNTFIWKSYIKSFNFI